MKKNLGKRLRGKPMSSHVAQCFGRKARGTQQTQRRSLTGKEEINRVDTGASSVNDKLIPDESSKKGVSQRRTKPGIRSSWVEEGKLAPKTSEAPSGGELTGQPIFLAFKTCGNQQARRTKRKLSKAIGIKEENISKKPKRRGIDGS